MKSSVTLCVPGGDNGFTGIQIVTRVTQPGGCPILAAFFCGKGEDFYRSENRGTLRDLTSVPLPVHTARTMRAAPRLSGLGFT